MSEITKVIIFNYAQIIAPLKKLQYFTRAKENIVKSTTQIVGILNGLRRIIVILESTTNMVKFTVNFHEKLHERRDRSDVNLTLDGSMI